MTDDIEPVDDGPKRDEAVELLDDHVELEEAAAEYLPTDVKDGEAGDASG